MIWLWQRSISLHLSFLFHSWFRFSVTFPLCCCCSTNPFTWFSSPVTFPKSCVFQHCWLCLPDVSHISPPHTSEKSVIKASSSHSLIKSTFRPLSITWRICSFIILISCLSHLFFHFSACWKTFFQSINYLRISSSLSLICLSFLIFQIFSALHTFSVQQFFSHSLNRETVICIFTHKSFIFFSTQQYLTVSPQILTSKILDSQMQILIMQLQTMTE